MELMKIYFAGSIRGGRDDAQVYLAIIEYLKNFGEVLTEHVGSKSLTEKGESESTTEFIYKRDLEWLTASDVIVAEVTQPSLGVGYELAYAEKLNKKVFCLFRKSSGKSLSAMIAGDKYFKVLEYDSLEDAKTLLDKNLKQ